MSNADMKMGGSSGVAAGEVVLKRQLELIIATCARCRILP